MKKIIIMLDTVNDYDLLCAASEHEVVWYDDYIGYEEEEEEED